MAIPKQGSYYTVASGDTIRTIARKAYGRDKSDLIISYNYETLKKSPTSLEGIPTIYPGNVLYIPTDQNRYNNEPITADFDTQLTVELNGVKLPGAMAGRISRSMNQIANGFVIEVPFDYTNAQETALFKPFTWYTARLFIGGQLYITALASKWDYSIVDGSNIATIECRTMPGEMLECMGMRKSLSFSAGMSLVGVCIEVAKPYGITCYTANGSGGSIEKGVITKSEAVTKNVSKYGDTSYTYTLPEAITETFGRIEQGIDETDAAFLQRLSIAKGYLITSMPDGNLLLCRANVKDNPSCALVQGKYPVNNVASAFDGSKRFSRWMGYTEESGVSGISLTINDTNISRPRGFVFKCDESKEGNIKTAIQWRMSKSIAESVTLQVSVSGWRNADGDLWAENQKVTGLFPGAFIFTETQFITESVELTKDDSGGDTTELQLVLTDSYTTNMPKPPFPWDGTYKAVT